jgi:hypothetical protein
MCTGGGGQQRYETEQERDARVGGQAQARTAQAAKVIEASSAVEDAQEREQASTSKAIFDDVKLGKAG